MTWPEFEADIERQYVAKHALLLAIQACLDICAHITAAAGVDVPTDYADLPRSLAKLGVLPEDLAERLAQATGLRNRLVHGYRQVVLEMIYEVLQEDLGDFDLFLTHVGKLIRRLAEEKE